MIRRETESRTVWVDALCNKQADVEERNERVKSMARIYSQATQVLVWLGEEDKYVDLAYNTSKSSVGPVKFLPGNAFLRNRTSP